MVVLNVRTPNPNVSRSPIRLYLVCYEQTQPAPGMKSLRVLSTNLSLGRFRQTFFPHYFAVPKTSHGKEVEERVEVLDECMEWAAAAAAAGHQVCTLFVPDSASRHHVRGVRVPHLSVLPSTFLIRITY